MLRTKDFNVMFKKLLGDCKKWGGPVTSATEILEVLRKNPDQQNSILRTETAHFVHTHKTEKTQRPSTCSGKILYLLKRS